MKRRPFLLAGLAAATGCPGSTAATGVAAVDWPPIRLLDGSMLAPASWQSRPAVLVFWATYCAYCLRHNAHVDRLHRATRGRDLRVLGVALDSDVAGVRRYMAMHGYGFPVTLDDGSLRRRFTARRVIPMTCVIDASGRLSQAIPGEMQADDVLSLADALR